MFKTEQILYAIAAAVLISALSAFGSWYITHSYVTAKFEAQIAKTAQAAAEEKTRLTEEKGKVELALAEARTTIDKEYRDEIAKQTSTIAGLRADNVRLRDPGKTRKDPAPGSAGAAGGVDASASGEGALSQVSTSFLLGFAGEADATLEQLRACRAWVTEVETKLDAWNKENQPKAK